MRYRRDGYCWKKRKDGKTTREDHMKLKVQGTEVSVLSFNYLIDFCVIFFPFNSKCSSSSYSCRSALRKKEHFSCFRLKARTVKINRFWLDFNFKEIVFWSYIVFEEGIRVGCGW